MSYTKAVNNMIEQANTESSIIQPSCSLTVLSGISSTSLVFWSHSSFPGPRPSLQLHLKEPALAKLIILSRRNQVGVSNEVIDNAKGYHTDVRIALVKEELGWQRADILDFYWKLLSVIDVVYFSLGATNLKKHVRIIWEFPKEPQVKFGYAWAVLIAFRQIQIPGRIPWGTVYKKKAI